MNWKASIPKRLGGLTLAIMASGGMALAQDANSDSSLAEEAGSQIPQVESYQGEDTELKAQLEKMVVTASGFEQNIYEAPASISIISREELESRPINSLADAIQDVTGVNFIGTSPNEMDISIRGMSGEYTLILVDGKRVNTRESRTNGSGGFEASYMPPLSAIERIEVIRGPMSTLYGSDAMGGVVNIITRKDMNRFYGSISLDHTFQDSGKAGDATNASLFVNAPLYQDKLAIQITGSGHYRPEDEITSGFNKRDNRSGNAKILFNPTENHRFTFDAGYAQQKREATVGKSVASSGRNASDSKSESKRSTYGLSYDGLWGEVQSKFNYQWERTKHETEGNVRKPQITNNTLDAQFTIPLPRNMVTVGGQYQHNKLEDLNYGYSTDYSSPTKIQMYQYALFLEDELSILDNLKLVGGIRLDKHEKYGSNWSPRAYLVWNPHPDFTIKGGVAKGFKAPGIRQLDPSYGYSTGGGVTAGVIYGDPDLKPETSLTEEISFAYHNQRGIEASLTFFNTDFKNKVYSYNTGLPDPITNGAFNLFKYENVGKARIRGIETGFVVPFLDDFKFTFNYTFLNSKVRSDTSDLIKGQPLTTTPKHSYNARFDWQATERLGLFTRMTYTGTQINGSIARSSATSQVYRSPFTTFDFGGAFKVNENARINFAVLNIANERETDPNKLGVNSWDAVREGRRFWMGLTIDF